MTDGSLSVRCADASDVGLIAPLFDAYRVFYAQPSDPESARRFLADRLARDEAVVLVAVDGSTQDAVGFAQLYRSFSSVSLGPIVILNDLFVVPAWRGRGVGRLLIEETARHARAAGAIRVEIATQHTNAGARRLYEALGFIADNEFVHLSLAME
jgi:GNAT superfamily N-acetyltransferase